MVRRIEAAEPMTDDDEFAARLRAELGRAGAEVEPTRTLADLRERIEQAQHDGGRHLCPVRKCPREVPDHLLMCGIHWRMVDAALRREVYAAYDNGRGLGTHELLAAQAAAIRHVNEQLAG
jgi:hypothetical protein